MFLYISKALVKVMEGAKKKSPSSSRRGLVRVPIRKGPVRQNPVSKSEMRIGTDALSNKVLGLLEE